MKIKTIFKGQQVEGPITLDSEPFSLDVGHFERGNTFLISHDKTSGSPIGVRAYGRMTPDLPWVELQFVGNNTTEGYMFQLIPCSQYKVRIDHTGAGAKAKITASVYAGR